MTHRARLHYRAALLKTGRWIAAHQPEAADPALWTRQTCAAWIAAVDRMKIGDHVVRTSSFRERLGQPLQAASKAGLIRAVRVFFRDIQDWQWVRLGFDPLRALSVPRTISALVGPNPRVIADDIWAKLLWAGLNLESADLPRGKAGPIYPLELVRAVTLTWLFAGQRSNEIARLRLGCIRWQHNGNPVAGDSNASSRGTLSACWTFPRTRPGRRSPNRSTRCSARPSTPGKHSAPSSRSGPTNAPENRSTSSSPTAPAPSPAATSTAASSPCSAARPASRPPTSAATSPATAPAPPSPASSTTPKNP